jgi:hypothetical protein
MHVIALHRPLDQSHAEPVARGGEHAPHDLHAELRTEIRQASPKPQRHVHGRTTIDPRASPMRDAHAAPPVHALATRALSSSAPPREHEARLRCWSCHRLKSIYHIRPKINVNSRKSAQGPHRQSSLLTRSIVAQAPRDAPAAAPFPSVSPEARPPCNRQQQRAGRTPGISHAQMSPRARLRQVTGIWLGRGLGPRLRLGCGLARSFGGRRDSPARIPRL